MPDASFYLWAKTPSRHRVRPGLLEHYNVVVLPGSFSPANRRASTQAPFHPYRAGRLAD